MEGRPSDDDPCGGGLDQAEGRGGSTDHVRGQVVAIRRASCEWVMPKTGQYKPEYKVGERQQCSGHVVMEDRWYSWCVFALTVYPEN